MTRIYTEDMHRKEIMGILDSLFAGYTIIPAIGRYKGVTEHSLVIELVDADPSAVSVAAELIKQHNHQESVLVVTEQTKEQFV